MVAVLLSLNVAATQQRSEDLIPLVRGPIFSSLQSCKLRPLSKTSFESGGR